MKTDLLEISRAAEAALAREIKSPTVSELDQKQATKSIYGFYVKDESEAQRYASSRLKTYLKDKKNLQQDLAQHGIEAKAILPERCWTKLCNKSGLVLLTPTKSGSIPINSAVVKPITIDRIEQWLVFIPLGTVVTVIVLLLISAFALTHPLIYTIIGLSIGFAIYSIGVCVAAYLAWMFRGFPNGRANLRIAVAGFFTRRRVNKALKNWPKLLGEMLADPKSGNTTANLILPPPPVSFLENLNKLSDARYPVRIAATPDAVAFSPSAKTLLLRDTNVAIEENARQLLASRPSFDPIAYVVKGSAVAVIDQFGDLAFEKKVVEEVISTHFAY